MSPTDPRHGTNAGYVAHCLTDRAPCQPCRTAHADYKRARRTRIYLAGGPLLVDPTGTHRRLEALMWLGWSLEEMSRALGKHKSYCSHLMRTSELVHIDTRNAVAELFDRWCMTYPPQKPIRSRTRNIARRRGYQSALAWDDIDDPTERPKARYRPAVTRSYDEAVVLRLLAGEHVDSRRADRDEAMRRWKAAGNSEKSLCDRLGWKAGRYDREREAS